MAVNTVGPKMAKIFTVWPLYRKSFPTPFSRITWHWNPRQGVNLLLRDGREESPCVDNCDPAEGRWSRSEVLPTGTLKETWPPTGKNYLDLM